MPEIVNPALTHLPGISTMKFLNKQSFPITTRNYVLKTLLFLKYNLYEFN